MSRKSSGLALIELLAAIAIIGVLAAIVFPVFPRARKEARPAADASTGELDVNYLSGTARAVAEAAGVKTARFEVNEQGHFFLTLKNGIVGTEEFVAKLEMLEADGAVDERFVRVLQALCRAVNTRRGIVAELTFLILPDGANGKLAGVRSFVVADTDNNPLALIEFELAEEITFDMLPIHEIRPIIKALLTELIPNFRNAVEARMIVKLELDSGKPVWRIMVSTTVGNLREDFPSGRMREEWSLVGASADKLISFKYTQQGELVLQPSGLTAESQSGEASVVQTLPAVLLGVGIEDFSRATAHSFDVAEGWTYKTRADNVTFRIPGVASDEDVYVRIGGGGVTYFNQYGFPLVVYKTDPSTGLYTFSGSYEYGNFAVTIGEETRTYIRRVRARDGNLQYLSSSGELEVIVSTEAVVSWKKLSGNVYHIRQYDPTGRILESEYNADIEQLPGGGVKVTPRSEGGDKGK